MNAELREAVERDPNPLVTGPTKWCAEHCVTHHYACDCREWEHACELHKWQGIAELTHGELVERLERAEQSKSLLRDVLSASAALKVSRDNRSHFESGQDTDRFRRVLARITAHLGGENNG
jgi:hypothetical protein